MRAQKRDALLPLTGGISDGFYIVTMGLGTPEQTVRLTIDTGSSNLALISEGCMYSGKPCTANHTFSPQESSTSSNDTCKYLTQCSSCNTSSTCDFEISYADGTNVKGKMLKDVITFANKSSEIYFGAITTDTRGNFASNITDGILGLAQDSIDTNHLPSFMSQISKNMNLRNMFSICMGYQGGSFILGGIDDYYHVGDIMYTPIFSDRYNTVKMPKIQIANYENSLNIPTANYYTYVDTGTTQVIVPADVMKSITNNFERLCEDSVLSPFICGKQNIFNYDPSPCFKFNKNIFSRLPDIKFQFQGMESNSVFEVSISPKNYILYIPSPDPDYDYCGKFGITSMDGVSVVILGDIFMKSLYVVFDYDNSKIGLAYSKNCGGTVQTSTSNPIAMVGIFLSLFVFFMGAAVMAFIVYFKTRRERYQRVNLNAL